MTLLLAPLLCLAQDAIPLPEPLPVRGEPVGAQVLAFALPQQKVAYITEDAPTHTCEIAVSLAADGAFELAPGPCPEPMQSDALDVTRQWRFAPPAQPTALRVRYVLTYSAMLGATTLHAELDPGADHLDAVGVPGVKLVHPVTLIEPIEAALPKSAIKAGLGPTTCTLDVTVDARGAVAAAAIRECPEPLAKDALKQSKKARFSPLTEDGDSRATQTTLRVGYVAD